MSTVIGHHGRQHRHRDDAGRRRSTPRRCSRTRTSRCTRRNAPAAIASSSSPPGRSRRRRRRRRCSRRGAAHAADRQGRGRETPGVRCYRASIPASAAAMVASPAGRTSRSISLPSRRKTSVGHSLTPNDRPSGRPEPSSMRICRTFGCAASAAASGGCTARQWPHQVAPNSTSDRPAQRVDFRARGLRRGDGGRHGQDDGESRAASIAHRAPARHRCDARFRVAAAPTSRARRAAPARTPCCPAGCGHVKIQPLRRNAKGPRGSKRTACSCCGRGSLAQLVEQRTLNPLVAGSIPARPTTPFRSFATPAGAFPPSWSDLHLLARVLGVGVVPVQAHSILSDPHPDVNLTGERDLLL